MLGTNITGLATNYRQQIRFYLGQSLGHLESAHGVHVGGHDGDAIVGLLRVPEGDLPVQVHVGPTLQSASLRPQEDIFEIQFYIIHYVWHLVCVCWKGLGSEIQSTET